MGEGLRPWLEAQEWREVTHVPSGDPLAAAAAFLTVLAYPDDTEKRDQFINALRSYATVKAGRPAAMRRRDVVRAMNRAAGKVNKRLRAADMAAKIMLERFSSTGIEASRSIREAILTEGGPITLTIRFPMPALSDAVEGSAPRPTQRPRPTADDLCNTNIMRDVWSPTKPVLHLALALRGSVLSQPDLPAFQDLLLNPRWSRKAIEQLPMLGLGLSQADIVDPEDMIILVLPAQN